MNRGSLGPRVLLGLLPIAALWIAMGRYPQPAQAQRSADSDAAPVECIALRQIERANVIDEDTLVFRMKGGDIYRNDLPRECPTLDDRNTFMYRVTTGRLCSVDFITVLLDVGSRFMPGASCGLGAFVPIGEVEAQALEVETRIRAERRP